MPEVLICRRVADLCHQNCFHTCSCFHFQVNLAVQFYAGVCFTMICLSAHGCLVNSSAGEAARELMYITSIQLSLQHEVCMAPHIHAAMLRNLAAARTQLARLLHIYYITRRCVCYDTGACMRWHVYDQTSCENAHPTALASRVM